MTEKQLHELLKEKGFYQILKERIVRLGETLQKEYDEIDRRSVFIEIRLRDLLAKYRKERILGQQLINVESIIQEIELVIQESEHTGGKIMDK